MSQRARSPLSHALRTVSLAMVVAAAPQAVGAGEPDPVPVSTETPPAAARATLVSHPRLTEDGRTLVLVDEVRAPTSKRQPEIRMGTNENSGAPQVQLAGASLAPAPDIAISCGWSRRSIPLTQYSEGPLRNVASYRVPPEIANMVRQDDRCHITLSGGVLPLPSDMVAIVWPSAP